MVYVGKFLDAILNIMCNVTAQSNLSQSEECMEATVFPTTNLYELETRIFTDQWSIPFKKEESLGKCLISATQLAEEGAVRNWGLDIQEGVRTMLHLLVNLVTARLKSDPVPEMLLQVLDKVMKLIDDSSSMRSSKIAIDSESLLNWLAENEILSIALEGSVHDKIKGIVEFTGHRLSLDELTKIWRMQDGQNTQIVDNIHSIMIAASSKYSSEQFDHLLALVQDIVELLWDLAHSPAIPMNVVELALQEHFSILCEVSHKEQIKKHYCVKCIEDIRKGVSVLPSLRLLHNICKNILKSGAYKQDRASLHELNKNHDIIKLITTNLATCHKQAVDAANGTLKPTTLVDGRYPHEDMHVIETKRYVLSGLQDVYKIWKLILSLCFFQYKLLKLDPSQLSYTGFICYKTFFESVNSTEHRLRRISSGLNVEKLELNGADFLWQVALSCEEHLANVAIEYLLEISYHALDVLSLHNRFINECYKKLENVSSSLSSNAMVTAVSNATKTLTAVSVFEVAVSPTHNKSEKFQSICRLLQIAERYISSIEENHASPRTILPHGTSFYWTSITHSNETLGSVKQRIAQYLHQNPSQVYLYQDEFDSKNKEQQLMSQLNVKVMVMF
ncbi:ubiquitin carboxyl-terminal hydrolase 24 [Caerostris extrusa]|uniref:Ubiquitin carboxyl-terminal hydrolase 24 n=1 Tax=Caerostris extrusa TaxID=172846 RepID=A0AAV4XMQ4_CAEEX|nr:ubiquitin carboxyl-terminal hydrolase 24 [Caerostris extrusa]